MRARALSPARVGRALRRRLRERHPYWHLRRRVLEVRDLACLREALGWTKEPELEGEPLRTYRGIEDLNRRRLRDAEVIGSACANGEPEILLEIGTGHGHTTALMARNAPGATVHTVNIPPEEVASGGRLTTYAPAADEIGSHYRALGLTNVRQILADTARWEPDFGPIDVAFIDGCHDADFVFRDSCKVLARCRPGSLVLWHDFHPGLVRAFPWIGEVTRGVERLYRRGLLRGPVLHLADSWVGLYRVPEP